MACLLWDTGRESALSIEMVRLSVLRPFGMGGGGCCRGRGGSRNSLTGGGGGFWARILRRGEGGLGSRPVGIFIY